MSTQQYQQPYPDDLEDDDTSTSIPRSAIRYAPGQGNAVYYGPPPVRRKSRTASQPAPVRASQRVRPHWLVYAGGLFMVSIIGWLVFTIVGAWYQSKVDDWTYGMPRTYQIDAVVGHGDSASNPSHFIAENLRGQIIVTEYPAGDVNKAHAYTITTLPDGDGYSPVTLKFKALTDDRRLDMLVLVGDPGSQLQVILYNTGSQFAAKP